MTRRKQQKNKKQNSAGVFISSLLNSGAKHTESKKTKHKQETREKVSEAQSVDISRFQSVVLFRTVLELALVNIALGSPDQPSSARRSIMSPPSASSNSGLSKLLSPVQDLGKSLLGFLVGSPVPGEQQAQCAVPATPGRQRPAGHPAHPAVNATPIVIRRSKVEKTQLKSQETDTPPPSLPSSLVREETEEPPASERPPPPAKPRSVSRSRKRKNKKCQQKQGDHLDQDPGNRKVSLSLDPQDASQVSAQSTISTQAEEVSASSQQASGSNEGTSTSLSEPLVTVKRRTSQGPHSPVSAENSVRSEAESCNVLDDNEKVSEVKLVHMKTCPVQDDIEFSRKEVLDIKDKSDKDNREVEEKSSTQLSSSACASETVSEQGPVSSSVPAPPPLPPPGYLLDGLKSDPGEKTTIQKSVVSLKSKPLSRKELLIDQLTGAEDPFTLFLKTQLNICQDPRERTGASDLTVNTETLRRKKDRRKAAESVEKSSSITKSEDQGDRTQPAVPAAPDERVKKSCQNARDRPISIVDIEEINTNNSALLNKNTDPDSVITQDSNSCIEKVGPSSEEDCVDSVKVDKKEEAGSDMIVEKPEEPSTDIESDMGAGQGTLLHQTQYSKQNLSKSDSGYSGQDDVDDVDHDVDNDVDHVATKKHELTVDQALRKYDRIVEQKPPQVLPPSQKPRNRVLSEGSEFSSDFSDTDVDDKDDDGKLELELGRPC